MFAGRSLSTEQDQGGDESGGDEEVTVTVSLTVTEEVT